MRKPRKNSSTKSWQVKGVSHETREAVKQAARKSGKPIGQWVDENLHLAAVDSLTGKETLPAKRLEDQIAEINSKIDSLSKPFWKKLFRS